MVCSDCNDDEGHEADKTAVQINYDDDQDNKNVVCSDYYDDKHASDDDARVGRSS